MSKNPLVGWSAMQEAYRKSSVFTFISTVHKLLRQVSDVDVDSRNPPVPMKLTCCLGAHDDVGQDRGAVEIE